MRPALTEKVMDKKSKPDAQSLAHIKMTFNLLQAESFLWYNLRVYFN